MDEDRRLLLRVSRLLEEGLENLEVASDREAVKAIREAEEDVKAGRVRGYDEFVEELKTEPSHYLQSDHGKRPIDKEGFTTTSATYTHARSC